VPSNKLICPHCGHDGTVETSRPPLGSFGFNYLAEGVVCREVRGYDDSGRLRLSGDFKCEGSQMTNARIECRSCWRTFPVPEGLLWTVVPEQPASAPEPAPASTEAAPADSLEAAVEGISRGLLAALRGVVGELEQAHSSRIARLEADVADFAKFTEEFPALRADVAGVQGQVASLREYQEQSQSRTAALETASRTQEAGQQQILERLGGLASQQDDTQRTIAEQAHALERLGEQVGQMGQSLAGQQDALRERIEALSAGVRAGGDEASRLAALCTGLQEAQQAVRQRLDAQAEVIRALHGAALEQTTRREELRAAVQRLEEIAGALNPVEPLPEEL
jgi:hypothetical protein